ncbi:cysteine--tRNA ligase [Enterobacteriaceae endosymbiont of Neohaemonia nigricornis]|uniref:cysteine--tRNA ligase n=1 Tax=Enterobacteriaceae endosymbiont of Neohaemonia nigricornis TaxID=2675792 RepID=UPI0014499D09|nr:cysteine--tRNA ligase [Enterobacteriaceae endosymbiont of Neohaemonia nigricornis]QJC30242.1 cysteine--tRNA ligase [Enterobacteriaceae endosymbiont of Neohaemonia nigricornis]
MLKIFNTLSKKKEIFQAIYNNKITIYVCGITPYDMCHIGHGRTFIIFDIIIRYFQFLGYKVKYIRNITDIDDKIIKLSNNCVKNINNIVSKMINAMHIDFKKLNIICPTIEPKVTEHITEIFNIIDILLKNNNAYIAKNGDIVFSVKSYKHYGQLSHIKIHTLHKNLQNNFFKKNYQDFVLWKLCDNTKIGWLSPWGYGRPGWHIECSAISHKYLGHKFDIHGGGNDLIFPHHENEIAQSICANKKFHVNYWIHTGMIIFNNKKMSKTLNNNIKLKDILLKYNEEVIRYFFTITHYRSPIIYQEYKLQQSSIIITKLYKSIYSIDKFKKNNVINIKHDLEDQFYKAMNNDFNTPKAYSILFKISYQIYHAKIHNKLLLYQYFMFLLKKLGNILGILFYNPKQYLEQHNKITTYKKYEIENLIQQRNNARKKKLWDKADNIRDLLKKENIILEDNNNHTTWKKI